MPLPATEEELELMALIDRCHLEYPYYGSRLIRDWLEDESYRVNPSGSIPLPKPSSR